MTDDMWAGTEVAPAKPSPASWLPERLPEDIDAERSFIATICAPGAGRVGVDALLEADPEYFVHPGHKLIIYALKSLVAKDLPIDSLTLKAELELLGTLNTVGGYVTLLEVLSGEDVERPSVLLDIIREKSKLRRLIHTGSKIVRLASGGSDLPTFR